MEDEEYLSSHPEISTALTLITKVVLGEQPGDVVERITSLVGGRVGDMSRSFMMTSYPPSGRRGRLTSGKRQGERKKCLRK